MPELQRIRSSLVHSDLFVVTQVRVQDYVASWLLLIIRPARQDIFPTETTALSDVVLPAAQWAEKTGCESFFLF
jgi:predicted molibdopterin-dependent oxidoreductase YjgC